MALGGDMDKLKVCTNAGGLQDIQYPPEKKVETDGHLHYTIAGSIHGWTVYGCLPTSNLSPNPTAWPSCLTVHG